MALKNMNAELKKVVTRVKSAQSQLQNLLKDRTWVEEAKKYAERQGKEVRKLIHADVTRLKTFLEKEKKELERLQEQLPGEVEKLKDFVQKQKKELKSLLASVKKTAGKKSRSSTGNKSDKKSKGKSKKSASRSPASRARKSAKASTSVSSS